MRSYLSEKSCTQYGRQKVSAFHRIAVCLCAVMLVCCAVVFVYISNYNKDSASIMPSFKKALQDGDYDKALSIYRDIHDTVVSLDPEKDADRYNSEVALMESMESAVSTRVESIENRIRYDRYVPSAADIKFLDGMGELTGSIISDWLQSLCGEFLLGTIEKPDITFIFEQVGLLNNISAAAKPLLREIDTIELSCGTVQSAEACYASEDYIGAVKTYQTVLSDSEGFVKDFSERRIEEIKEVMYEPMLEKCEHMIETFKYYSAETLLSDLASIFPEDDRINADLIEATSNTSPVVEYSGSVQVLCVRQLIADNEVAFGATYISNNDDIYLTTSEFSAILEQLYERNYVLVDAEGLVDLSNEGFLAEQQLVVPEGKKPLILVIDSLDYSAKNYGSGTCDRLVINDQGQVCGEYESESGQSVVSRTAEAIGILDSFVEQHPDFSYNGAKGVISVCGYESCFGYVVNEDEIDDRNLALTASGYPTSEITSQEIADNCNTVKRIADLLKDTGWKFASSTYGNINAEETDMATLQSDTQKWIDQIGSLLGETHMIVYPNGNFINGTDSRAEYLKSLGFRIFFGIGSQPYYTYGTNYLYYDRAMLNGNTLRTVDYSSLFDVSMVYDASRVKPLTDD